MRHHHTTINRMNLSFTMFARATSPAALAFAVALLGAVGAGTAEAQSRFDWNGSSSTVITDTANWVSGSAPTFGGTLANARIDVINGANNTMTYTADQGTTSINSVARALVIGNSSAGSMLITGGTLQLGTVAQANLIGANSVNGTLTIDGGAFLAGTQALQFGINSTSGTATLTLTSGSANVPSLAFGQTSGSAARAVVNLDGGTFVLGTTGTTGLSGLANAATFNFNGGTLQSSGSTTNFLGGFTTANVGTGGAVINAANAVTITQGLLGGAGDGGLTKSGASALTLTGSSTFTGNIAVNAGGLGIGSNGRLGTSGTYAGTITLASGGSTRFNWQSDANQTFTGSIVSSGANTDSIFFLTDSAPTGSGTVTLAAASPDFRSRLIVGGVGSTNVATLLLSHSNALQAASLEPRSDNKVQFSPGIGTFNIGVMNFGGLTPGQTMGSVTLADTSGNPITLSVGSGNRSSDLTGYNGTLSGAGGLTKVGLGKQTLSGANTYTGATTIAGGTLALGAGGSFANSSSIIVGNAGSSGAVLDLTAKTGSFDIGSGQTLGGGGTVQLASSGTLNVLGLLSPGNSPGLFTFDAGTTILSGTTLMEVWGTSRATDPSHGTGFYDAVNVVNGGGLTLGGQLQLNFDQLFADNTTFDLFTASGGSLAGNFTGVSVTSSSYTGLTWTQDGSRWTSSATPGGQSLEFNATSGQLVIVPEPGALALAGLGVAATAWAARRRRNTM